MKFRNFFEKKMTEFQPYCEKFPWEDKTKYMWWLSQTCHFVQHSSVLLSLCSARFGAKNTSFHIKFLNHAKKEAGHDKLALKDLKTLGGKIEHFEELHSTSMFYRNQYYLIDHISPIAFLGYIFLLEGIAIKFGTKLTKSLTEMYGSRSTSFLKVHAENDIEHLENAFSVVDSLTDQQKNLVIRNFLQSSAGYIKILDEVESRSDQPGALAA